MVAVVATLGAQLVGAVKKICEWAVAKSINNRILCNSISCPMDLPQERLLRRYFALLAEDLTPAQAARAAEKWELICEQEGWLYLSETHPYAPPAVSKHPEPPPP